MTRGWQAPIGEVAPGVICWQARSHASAGRRVPPKRRNRLITTVSTTLRITIEVIGMNTRLRSDSMRMSPGSRPNQLSSPGK